ncbi:uncharacterized protein LOC142348113 [Convolutriloba macropyga]|uniref:uncharacterized protein LOC142348113 n=1 Tax=Convolutriloba macropyga TaxID=536237 RepID=UPI003F51CB05
MIISLIFMSCILATVHCSNVLISPSPAASNWSSMLFVMPQMSSFSILARDCAQFSSRFCFLGVYFNTKQSDREPQTDDFLNFFALISATFRSINWFSLSDVSPHERGKCCGHQLGIYRLFGHKNGLSPADYMDAVADFASGNKHLNLIKVSNNLNPIANPGLRSKTKNRGSHQVKIETSIDELRIQ